MVKRINVTGVQPKTLSVVDQPKPYVEPAELATAIGAISIGDSTILRITIELLPGGDKSRRKVLAVGNIANDGTGSVTQGNYQYALSDGKGRLWQRGSVFRFPRKRLLAWDLLFRVLRDAVQDRNGSNGHRDGLQTKTPSENPRPSCKDRDAASVSDGGGDND